jgi:hypothetical protein
MRLRAVPWVRLRLGFSFHDLLLGSSASQTSYEEPKKRQHPQSRKTSLPQVQRRSLTLAVRYQGVRLAALSPFDVVFGSNPNPIPPISPHLVCTILSSINPHKASALLLDSRSDLTLDQPLFSRSPLLQQPNSF